MTFQNMPVNEGTCLSGLVGKTPALPLGGADLLLVQELDPTCAAQQKKNKKNQKNIKDMSHLF